MVQQEVGPAGTSPALHNGSLLQATLAAHPTAVQPSVRASKRTVH